VTLRNPSVSMRRHSPTLVLDCCTETLVMAQSTCFRARYTCLFGVRSKTLTIFHIYILQKILYIHILLIIVCKGDNCERAWVYSPAAEHQRPLAGTHLTVPRRVEGWVDLGGWLLCCKFTTASVGEMILTRRSAIVEEPRDVLCQLKHCKRLHNYEKSHLKRLAIREWL